VDGETLVSISELKTEIRTSASVMPATVSMREEVNVQCTK